MTGLSPTPIDTANFTRTLRDANESAPRREGVRTAPLRAGRSLNFRNHLGPNAYQGRLHLSKADARRYDLAWGIVISHKNGWSVNTAIPACARVMLRISRIGEIAPRNRNIFVRTSAYASGFHPREVAGKPRTIAIWGFGIQNPRTPPIVAQQHEPRSCDF